MKREAYLVKREALRGDGGLKAEGGVSKMAKKPKKTRFPLTKRLFPATKDTSAAVIQRLKVEHRHRALSADVGAGGGSFCMPYSQIYVFPPRK